MRILIIGYGSIGARHGRVASSLGMSVACVTRNLECPFPRFASISEALETWTPDRVLIANPTSQHGLSLRDLHRAGYTGSVLVEKPVFSSLADAPEPGAGPVYVAYNLRFHPLVQQLRGLIDELELHTAVFQAGQYLPQWRPGSDYRQSYSAHAEMGGGVLRDLSHEIDLALWLCGPSQRVTALGGHFSDLEIDSDDTYSMLSVNQRCPSVSIMINYLEQAPRRQINLNGRGTSIALDLIKGTLSHNADLTQVTVERDVTYSAQLQAFAEQDASSLCTLQQGLGVVRLIEAAEQASATHRWITP